MTESSELPTITWVGPVVTTQGPAGLSDEEAIDWINASSRPTIIDNDDDNEVTTT